MHYMIVKKRMVSPGKWKAQLVTLCDMPKGLDGTRNRDKVTCPDCLKLMECPYKREKEKAVQGLMLRVPSSISE